MTVTVRIDHQHVNPLAALRSGDLEMPKLMAMLKPADTLRIVTRQINEMKNKTTAKGLGMA